MTTIETEIFEQEFGGVDPQAVLRTMPHEAGPEFNTDERTQVWVTLGQRPKDDDGPFNSLGPCVTIAPNPRDLAFTLDYGEEDAIKLVGALALAIGDLRAAQADRA